MNSVSALPKRLKLEISKATDCKRINRLFEPEVKQAVDPNNHVVKRLRSVFKKAVDSGCAAFLSDENGDLRAMAIAYHAHVEKNHAPESQHDHTEIGTALSLIPGYKSSSLIMAALTVREWLNHPPLQEIATWIDPENAPAMKIIEALGWEVIRDKGQCTSLNTACWRTVPDETDPTGQAGVEKIPEGYENLILFECNRNVLAKQARVILDFMDQGGLINRKTGHFIPVDFSSLDKEGLTRPRLEAIAEGMMSGDKYAKGCVWISPGEIHEYLWQ